MILSHATKSCAFYRGVIGGISNANTDSIFKQPTVVASQAKQSISPRKESKLDCFVARAPRNDGNSKHTFTPRGAKRPSR